MYTNLTVPSNPELTPMIPMLEYIVDNNELHNFALQIARGMFLSLIQSHVLSAYNHNKIQKISLKFISGMKHLEEKQITHR